MRSGKWNGSRRIAALWRDKWLLLLSLIILWFVRLSLSLAGYNRMIRRASLHPPRPFPSDALALRVATAVRAASVLVPKPTCLVQALAVKLMLMLRGYGSEIEVGVRRSGTTFGAHAWLTSNGKVVIGGDSENIAAFRPLLRIE